MAGQLSLTAREASNRFSSHWSETRSKDALGKESQRDSKTRLLEGAPQMMKSTRITILFTILSTAWLWLWAGPGVPAQQPKPADADEPAIAEKLRPILKAKPLEPT